MSRYTAVLDACVLVPIALADTLLRVAERGMVTGWEALEPGIRLPDQDDRHVVAAGICGRADAIVTMNRADFPAAALNPFMLEAIHPDDFLLDQLDLSPQTVLQVIREQAARTRNPSLAPRDLATILGRAGVPGFADEVLRLMAAPLDGV